MPRTKKPNDLRAQVEACNEAFKEVENSVAEFEAAEATARRGLYVALERLFDFGEVARSNLPMLKRFVVGREGKWGKIAEENPFQPLVKLAFPKAHEASQSQYAKVLSFAHDVQAEGKLPGGIAEWLDAHPGGLDGAYKAAVDHFMAPSKRRTLEDIRRQQLASAKQALNTRTLSSTFQLSKPLDIADGFVMALVRIKDGAEAMIVDLMETNQERLEASLLRHADPVASEMDLLAGKPLFSFFRAVDLLLGTVGTGFSTDDLVLLIEAPKQDKARCHVYVASSKYSFIWAQVALETPLPRLPAGATFSFGKEQAEAFRRDFRADGEFSLLPAPAGKADFRLSSSGAGTEEANLNPFVPGAARLRVGCLPSVRTRPFLLPHDAVASFVKWHDTLKRTVTKRGQKAAGRAVPNRLELTWYNGEVSVQPAGVLGISLDVMKMSADPSFRPDRWLALEDFRRLCDAVLPYAVDLHGWLVDGDVPQSALLFEHDFGDRFQVLMPLVTSADMHYALTCEDLQQIEPNQA